MEVGHRLTGAIIEEAVRTATNAPTPGSVKLLNFHVEGTAKGDGMVCDMKAVTVKARVDGKEETFDFIAKSMPTNEVRIQFMVDGDMFIREVLAYKEFLPEMHRLNTTGKPLSVPACYYASNEDRVILMENLKLQNYRLLDKKVGCTLDETKTLLESLSHFHAVSYYFVQTYPGGVDALRGKHQCFFQEAWVNKNPKGERSKFEQAFPGLIKTVADLYKERDPEVAAKLDTFAETYEPAFDEALKAKGNFLVLIHGDCWMNNCMARVQDDKVDQFKLVDLQMMRYTRPTVDLTEFIHCSTTPEVLRDHQEDLLRHYHQHLTAHLRALGYSDPDQLFSFQDLHQQYDDTLAFGLTISLMAAPLIHAGSQACPGGAFDMESLQTGDDLANMGNRIDTSTVTAVEKAAIFERVDILVDEASRHGLL